ncbi:MAG: hypothetical protein ACYTGJ_09500 [Planctomycetota bacterium]|jgi:hypothetical protein
MTPIAKALLAFALLLSVLAFVSSRRGPAPLPPSPSPAATPGGTSALEAEIRQLRGELLTFEARLAAVEESGAGSARPSGPAGREGTERSEGLSRGAGSGEVLDARIDAAVRAAIETDGVSILEAARRRAEREKQRAGFESFTARFGDGLPEVYRRMAEEMSLEPSRLRQVQETLEAGWLHMEDLVAQMGEDLPPEEERIIMGEIKGSAAGTIQELGGLLSGPEMLQLGEIMTNSEGTERMGQGVIGAGKVQVAETGGAETP